MPYLLEYRSWRLLLEAEGVSAVAYSTSITPIGPDPSDGLIILTPSPNVEIASIKINGVEITQPLAQPLLKYVTKFGRSDWGDYHIFVKSGAKFELQIQPTGSDQLLSLPVKMPNKTTFAYYLAQPGWTPLALSAKFLPMPKELKLPTDHQSRLERASAEGGCCLAVKPSRAFSRVDCNQETVTKGQNWIELAGVHFFYLTSTSFSLTFDFAPTRVTVNVGQLAATDGIPRLETGAVQYVELV